ncbi:MAG: hypothetical protein J6V43_00030, partial [Rikenellaceae bacterium]|nr:hypothetical protein [Rikenellaceae bacterium]
EVVSASNIYVNLTNGSLDYSSAEATNEVRVNLAEAVELNTETPATIYAMITPGHAGKTFQAIAVVGGKEVVLGEMAVPETGIPAGVKATLSLNVAAPEVEPAEAIDLSAAGTANCYIVNKANTAYKFKANVKGNGYAPMAGETAEIAPTKARILWAQAGYTMTAGDSDDAWPSNLGNTGAVDLVSYTSVALKDDYVYFTTGENMGNGNVVIAATDDAGNILWSWHIWALKGYDVAASDYYVTASDLNVYMMDRNLGATATPSATADTNNEWVGARGYFYQWGRKDPFIGHSIKWNGYEAQALVYDADGKPTVDAEGNVAPQYVSYGESQIFPRVSASDIPNAGDVYASVAYAVANPMTYLTGGASYMWTAGNDAAVVSGATNEWGKLWGNQAEEYSSWDKGGVKTMYDPCPAGYRVPSTGHFRFITSHGDNAGAYYNSKADWKYNTVEKVFNEEGTAIYENHGQSCPPYGFHFYVKGSLTASPDAVDGAQDYGVAPADKTTAYFPAQGLFRWNGDEKTSGGDLNVVMHTNAVKNAEFYGYATYIMHATAKGEFFNNAGTIGWGEQQAKALPVRCFREDATVTPEPEPEPVDPAIDLSAKGTANAYIVNTPATEYKFKATVKGNGATTLSGDNAAIAPTKARILWAQNQTTTNPDKIGYPVEYGATNADNMIDISSIVLKDGYVRFTTGAEMPNGNVGIVVTDDNDNILWSWHLWVVNGYDPAATDVYVATKGVNTYFMDRNLGAFCNYATIQNPDKNDHIASRGLYYQWGRKDPFIGHQSANGYATKAKIYDASGVGTEKYSCYGGQNLGDAVFQGQSFDEIHNALNINNLVAWTVANPNVFVQGTASSGYTWVGGTKADVDVEWTKLWGNAAIGESLFDKGGVKTMYDPCPVGYRVPSTGHYTFITSHGDQSSTGYGNPFRNWQYNCVEKIWDETGTAYGKAATGNGVNWAKEAPYGLNYYANGVKTKSEGAQDNVQDYGVLPTDQSTIYFPAQGWIPYGFGCSSNENELQYQTNRPAKGNVNCYRMASTNAGEFYYGWTAVNWGQAMGLPVRCVRE